MSGNLNRHTISKDPQNKKGAGDKFKRKTSKRGGATAKEVRHSHFDGGWVV